MKGSRPKPQPPKCAPKNPNITDISIIMIPFLSSSLNTQITPQIIPKGIKITGTNKFDKIEKVYPAFAAGELLLFNL